MDGSYTLGGTTTNFTNAAVTYSVTADSSSVVSATASNAGYPTYYLPVSSVTITLTSGSTTTTLAAVTQGPSYQMAVVSYRDPATTPTWSGIGFAAIDVVSPNSPTSPHIAVVAGTLGFGSSLFTNLQTTGSFAGFNFLPVNSLQVSSGGLSGTLDVGHPSSIQGPATMTISPATAVPGGSGAFACGAALWARRRRR